MERRYLYTRSVLGISPWLKGTDLIKLPSKITRIRRNQSWLSGMASFDDVHNQIGYI